MKKKMTISIIAHSDGWMDTDGHTKPKKYITISFFLIFFLPWNLRK